MAKASLTLSDGTKVIIEGNPEEIRNILALHWPSGELDESKKKVQKKPSRVAAAITNEKSEPDLSELVNAVKSCDEAELIEKNVLDRSSQVDRTLLPIYVAHKYLSNKVGLTSGEIAKVLAQLGINVLQPNVAKTLSSTASKYVIGDKMRRKGQPVRYSLSRRGLQYLSTVIQGKTNE